MTRSRRSTRSDPPKDKEEEDKQDSGEEEKDDEGDNKEEDEKSPVPKQEDKGRGGVFDDTGNGDVVVDPEIAQQNEIIKNTEPQSELEIALTEALRRRDEQIENLSAEVGKLKEFISKRKQTYKRKRKESGAPTRALSAYNIFVQDRFSRLAKENEQALKSNDTDAKLKRVPPASLVASTGNEWKELAGEEKAHYEER